MGEHSAIRAAHARADDQQRPQTTGGRPQSTPPPLVFPSRAASFLCRMRPLGWLAGGKASRREPRSLFVLPSSFLWQRMVPRKLIPRLAPALLCSPP